MELIAEIKNYIQHADYDVAIRRALDAAFDTQNEKIIREAIQCSKEYRSNNTTAFLASIQTLLTAIEHVPFKQVDKKNLLHVQGVKKVYAHSNFSLKPISFQLNNGEVLGVVGENGNGKTTLLRLLAGQLSMDGGHIQYPLLQHANYYTIKNHIAFIPQRIPRWYGFLKDNLHFSASIAGVTGNENDYFVKFILERLNLQKYAHLTWEQISSGYRTRFEIARILLQKPSILILDEPLANLDIIAQQTILTDLKMLAKSNSHPLGVILSSQQLHEVEKIADEVLLIKNGECIQTSQKIINNQNETVIEIETNDSREKLETLIKTSDVKIQFNGNFYTLSSSQLTADELLKLLITAQISISYFRNISTSTKRFF